MLRVSAFFLHMWALMDQTVTDAAATGIMGTCRAKHV